MPIHTCCLQREINAYGMGLECPKTFDPPLVAIGNHTRRKMENGLESETRSGMNTVQGIEYKGQLT